eukprot:TRINITY_DN3108_c0_g1_i1.p1 TRINITY_DN3108_c0_g1~~TRINITY_DN3108_c0_g1_i1.p1  ORF type:complete len:276 (-),score=49.75 TRINITY_DN3108_c0_g1_i1:692-1519(-)
MIYVGHHELVKWTSDDVSDAALLRWLQGDAELQVEHLCNHPSCSNPTHLHLCTSTENRDRRCASAGAVRCSRGCNDDMPALFCAVLHPSTPPCVHAAQMAVHQDIASRRAKWEQMDGADGDLNGHEIATWGKAASEDLDYALSQATNKELLDALQRSTGSRDARSDVHLRVGAMNNATFRCTRERIAARLHTSKWWLDATLRTIVPRLTASHLCHCDTCVDPAHLVAEPLWYNCDRKLCVLEYQRDLQLVCKCCGAKIAFQCPHVPACIPDAHTV